MRLRHRCVMQSHTPPDLAPLSVTSGRQSDAQAPPASRVALAGNAEAKKYTSVAHRMPAGGRGKPSLRRRMTAFASTLAALAFLILAPAAQASSKEIIGTVGEGGSGAGQVELARGMAINETGSGPGASVGDLYISDTEFDYGFDNGRIDEFGSTGNFIRAFGWGVATGSNEYQICTTTCQAATTPNPPDAAGSMGNSGETIAVDQSSGNVFLTDNDEERIDIFSADGRFEGAFGFGVSDGASHLEFCTTTCQQGGRGAGAGAVNYAEALAVDPTTGNLYVGDPRNGRIDDFSFSQNGSGEVTGVSFVRAFGWGVESGASEFQVCTTASGCRAGLEGQGIGEFGNYEAASSLSVNSSGVVYVEDGNAEEGTFTRRVESFTPSGSSYTPELFDPAVLSTTSSDYQLGVRKLIITNDGSFLIAKGFPEGAATCPGGTPSPSEVMLLTLSASGTVLNTDAACAGQGYFQSVARNPVSNDLYGSGGGVYVFGATSPPTASITAVTPNAHGASISGTVNPEGPAVSGFANPPTVSYQLEYKKSTDPTWSPWGKSTNLGSGTQGFPVNVKLGGLEANVPYEVRFAFTKSYNEGSGTTAPYPFTTLPVGPTIEGDSTSEVTATSAVLNANINPHGTATSYYFEYGTTTKYGQVTPETNIGASLHGQAVKVEIANLQNTVYHFRVIAQNADGTATSEDQTFNFYPPPGCPNSKLRELTGASDLPDCRAYELVTPANSEGAIIFPNNIAPNSPTATNPSRFGFTDGLVAMPGTGQPINGFGTDLYVSTRTDSGWQTKFIGVPGDETNSGYTRVGNSDMSKFLSFDDNSETSDYSTAPYLYNFDDEKLGMWPSDARSIPGGTTSEGTIQPSADFTHMAFSSETVDFTAGQGPGKEGLTAAPGSIYDFNSSEDTTTLISETASGNPIGSVSEHVSFPIFSSGGEGEITPRAANGPVSSNGTHILMTTSSGALYMKVDDASTYEVSDGKGANYVGMTPDGSKVFFTSNEQLTPEDTDSSTDLYMWSESTGGLKEISIGNNGGGNSNSCGAEWTPGCDVAPVDTSLVEFDSAIAAETGEIYFFSPEQLDGTKGVEGLQNLYVYRGGEDRFVATFDPGSDCIPFGIVPHCSVGPIDRIDVAPSGEYVAFLTSSPLTSYDNTAENGICDTFSLGESHDGPRCEEMYRYAPASDLLKCVSCNPTGAPPIGDVSTSYDGLFMTSDGRVFFFTPDSLVSQDTNDAEDVYEYVDGRPQLITSGTGTKDVINTGNQERRAGLMGVSANGVDAYFATYEGLVPQDRNGDFERIYDARTNGGFALPTESEPCASAEECHGVSSESPAPFVSATSSGFGNGGNAAGRPPQSRHSRRDRSRRHRSRSTRRIHRRSVGSTADAYLSKGARRHVRGSAR